MCHTINLAPVVLLIAATLSLFGQVAKQGTRTDSAPSMDQTYRDETHCLVGPEIRKDADMSISCYCRDALADARYIYQTYVITRKDRNLNGAYLQLVRAAEQTCAKSITDVYSVTQDHEWRWTGPEVIRTYPPDHVIEGIKPAKNGFRTYSILLC